MHFCELEFEVDEVLINGDSWDWCYEDHQMVYGHPEEPRPYWHWSGKFKVKFISDNSVTQAGFKASILTRGKIYTVYVIDNSAN